MKAIWNNTIIAESSDIVTIERNAYFPIESVKREYLHESNSLTDCPWKGTASYYTLKVHDQTNTDAAWFYPNPGKLAESIKNRVAFWKGVKFVND